MRKLLLLILTLFIADLAAMAGRVSEAEALQKAQQFMQSKQFMQKNLRRAPSVADNGYYVFNVENKGGFVIVAGDDRMPDILGFSENGNFDLSEAPDNVKWLMDHYDKIAKSLKENNTEAATRRAPIDRPEVQPLIKTTWDQGSPYNLHCPVVKEGYMTLTGCVATAMAQVVNFFQWPLEDVKAIAGYTTGDKVEVTALPAKKINWYNMSEDDIAWLMRYCGQAVLMNYGISESGAAPSNIPYALSSYFGFSKSTKIVDYTSYSDSDWEEMIYNEVNLGRPVIYSGFLSGGGSGHSFVVHGYRDGMFMVNWGWSGDCDGYFTLTNLAPNEYMDFSSDQNAVIGIQPAVNNSIDTATTINVEKAGTLANYISDDDKYSITELVVSGEINGTDLRLIREMAGNNYKGEATDGKLEKLDLSDVTIIEGGEPYIDTQDICYFMKDNNISIYVESPKQYSSGNKISSYLFAGCTSLKYIRIPEKTIEIETKAFDGTNLKEIFIPKSVTKIDIEAFNNFCRELSSISIAEDNPVYTTMGNYNAIIEKATGKLIIAFCSTSEVPEGVKIIGSHAFDGCGTSLGSWPKLPESLTTIEESAMKGCNGKVIFIPKNLISIGQNAIHTYAEMIKVDADNPKYDSRQNCNAIIETATNTLLFGSRLTEIPEGITSISDYAVSGWHIRRIDLPQSLQTMKESALDMGSGLEMVKVHNPEPIEIPQNTFCQVSSTAKLIVPDGSKEKYATAAGWSSFQNISEVSENLPKLVHVATAGSLASLISEEEKYTIESLTLTGQLNAYDFKFIREMSEQAETGILRKIDMSDARIVAGGESTNANVEVFKKDDVLGERALWWAIKLEQIILPSTLKGIEESAFEGCINLKSLIIPKSVVEIGWATFAYTYKLSSLSVEEGNPIFDSREDCNAIIETATNTMRYGCPTTTFPTSVTAIGEGAFIGQLGLTSITIPDVISTIGDGAFRNCEGLTSITIPAGISSIDTGGLLRGCTKLESIKVSLDNPYYDSRDNCNAIIETATNTLLQGCYTTKIPSTITKIAPYAFGSIEKLVSIEIPSSVTEIGDWAFAYNSQLSRVVCHIKKPLVIGNFVFLIDRISDAILYVPYGTKTAYASTPGWDVFGNIIEMAPDDSYQGNSASIAINDLGKHYAAVNGEVEVPISITGEGITPITNIDYTITTGTTSKEYHLEVEPISYMMTAEVLIPFAADATTGEQTKTLKITKVNGVVNECTENVSATGTLVTVAKKPKIIPVVEEYTGTWCGWCARGIVGLKMLDKTLKKDVITIAIHDGGDNEPMMLPEYRSTSGSYPSCQINRGELMDPYYGTGQKAFGIKREVEAAQRDYALGSIEMTANWTDDTRSAIDIRTTTTFVEDVAESPYQIGYILLENGVKGTGDEWAQSNYYAGSNTNDENLKELTNKPSKITDMKYDNVPVQVWEPMTGVAGTIPATITHDVPMEYTFKVDISENTRIQNKDRLTVVVLLLDKSNGKIVNAAKFSLAPAVTITAKSYTREYGEANPTFGYYTVEGVELDGTPDIMCEATATSPVGTYPIIISKGNISNDNDTYIDGTLTITKAPLNIAAGTYTKKQGDPMPEFTLIYDGFKNNETDDVLTTKPTVTCEASKTSKPGEYVVKVSGAEAENYAITHVDGMLIVTDPRPGDITGSGSVDVQDATLVVNYILGITSDEYNYNVADMNGDGEVDVFDVTAMINIILSDSPQAAPKRRSDLCDSETVMLTQTGMGVLLGIENAERFTSFQLDIELSDGLELQGVDKNSIAGHSVRFAKIGDNRYRVVGLSMNSTPLPAGDDSLLELLLSGNNDGNVTVDNVLFVTPEGKAAFFNGSTLTTTTGIQSVTYKQSEQIYDLYGHKLDKKRGQLPKGVYIINNQKVVIK